MGRTVKILKRKEVPHSLCNNRFTVELCENIHIHYRNIRLEFQKEEFLHILNLISKINIEEIKTFPYNDYNFKLLVEDFNLPTDCEYNNRLQIELQKEGHYHIHYRNCRLEFNKLREIGFSKINFIIPLLQYQIKCLFSQLHKRYLQLYKLKPTNSLLLNNLKYQVDEKWAKQFINIIPKYRNYSIKYLPLRKLKAVLFVKEGLWTYPLNVAPPYLFLQGNKEAYLSYCKFKDTKEGADKHNMERFEELLFDFNHSQQIKKYIVVNRKNEILDGLHRACLLLHKYGPDYKIHILKLEWIDEEV